MLLSKCADLASGYIDIFARETIKDKKTELIQFNFLIRVIDFHRPDLRLRIHAAPLFLREDEGRFNTLIFNTHNIALSTLGNILKNLNIPEDFEVISDKDHFKSNLQIAFSTSNKDNILKGIQAPLFSQLATEEKIFIARSLLILGFLDLFFEIFPNPMETPLCIDLLYLLFSRAPNFTEYRDSYIKRFSYREQIFFIVFEGDRDQFRNKKASINSKIWSSENLSGAVAEATYSKYRPLDDFDIAALSENKNRSKDAADSFPCYLKVVANLLLAQKFDDLHSLIHFLEYDRAYSSILTGQAGNIFAQINGLI